VAFAIFTLLKAYNATQKKKEEEPAQPSGPTEIDLLKEIRDSLKNS
jgi:large conductance mechanosensitive channel